MKAGVKDFLNDINPGSGFKKMVNSINETGVAGMTTSDKIALGSAVGLPYAAGAVGAIYGATQDGEGSVSAGADKGFQVGGMGMAIAAAASPLARKSFGRTGIGALMGGSMSTMATGFMQDEDAGVLQRTAVNFASLAGGMVAGGLLGKASMKVGKFTKPV